jgi:pseudouridine synthase
MKERLQKILAKAGVASRRAAEDLILAGRVTVNGEQVTRLGDTADLGLDKICVDGRPLPGRQTPVYLMLHKPPGYVTTLHDPQGRPTVGDLLLGIKERVFHVGRLDYDSEGLLLLTNDGDFAQKTAHPRYGITRTYRVKVRGRLGEKECACLREGVLLEDGRFAPRRVEIEKTNPGSTWLTLVIHEGRRRVIRRALAELGYPVQRLMRVRFGPLELGDLPPGRYRHLSALEVQTLLLPFGDAGESGGGRKSRKKTLTDGRFNG